MTTPFVAEPGIVLADPDSGLGTFLVGVTPAEEERRVPAPRSGQRVALGPVQNNGARPAQLRPRPRYRPTLKVLPYHVVTPKAELLNPLDTRTASKGNRRAAYNRRLLNQKPSRSA
jgi:hypothetical protein